MSSILKLLYNQFQTLCAYFVTYAGYLTSKKLSPNETASSSFLQDLRHNGFVVIPQFLNPKDTKSIFESINSCLSVDNTNPNDKPYEQVEEPFLACPEICDVAVNQTLLDLIDDYYGRSAYITGVNLRVSYANKLPAKHTQLFHVDKGGSKLLKAFIYLNDVDIDGGPLVYIRQSNTRKFPFWNRSYRLSDEVLRRKYPREDIVPIVANAGDLIVADTFGFHKGMKPIARNRALLTINYCFHREFGSKKIFKFPEQKFNRLRETEKSRLKFCEII